MNKQDTIAKADSPRVGDAGDSALDARVASLETTVNTLTESIQSLLTVVQQNLAAPQGMKVAQSPEKVLEAHMKGQRPQEMRQWRRNADLLNPRAGQGGFQPEDIVALKEDTDKYKLIKKKVKEGDEMPLGVVLSRMYTKRNGQGKYKVHFKGWGEDGCSEDELVLVRAA